MSFYTEFGKSKEKYRKYRPAYPCTLFTEIMNNSNWNLKKRSSNPIHHCGLTPLVEEIDS